MLKINKVKGAPTNTFEAKIDALSSRPPHNKVENTSVNVMFTSGVCGETISILDPTTKKSISLSYESIMKLVDHARNEDNGRGR